MTPSLEGWPTKAKEAPSPHEVRLTLLDTNPVFLCLRDFSWNKKVEILQRIGDTENKNCGFEKLLGIKVDRKLNFNEHLNNIINKASLVERNVLLYMILMNFSKKKKLVNSFSIPDLVTAPLSAAVLKIIKLIA